MNFQTTSVEGCFLIEPTPRGDHRGFFARIFDAEIFRDRGLANQFVQFNNSLSVESGTLRGLHYQRPPSSEDKLVRCIAGSVFDVVLDMRKNSPTFGLWAGEKISASNRRMMLAPKGCAHGFMTLEANTELVYFASAPYAAPEERIIRWDDPKFAIRWPRAPTVLSDKDRDAPDYDPTWHDVD